MLRTATYGDGAGTVTAFDKATGLGEIASGVAVYPFHCTALSDGTRDVAVGTEVHFTIAAGHLGRLEATHINS